MFDTELRISKRGPFFFLVRVLQETWFAMFLLVRLDCTIVHSRVLLPETKLLFRKTSVTASYASRLLFI